MITAAIAYGSRQADAARDQEHEPRRQRRADAASGKERAQAIDAEHRTGNHRKQMRGRRVVRHLAHRAVERSIVHQVAGLLDVIDEQEVMRQIGAAPRRQQRRPRHPQERRDQEEDDAEPRDQVARLRIRGPLLQRRGQAGDDDRTADRRPRLETESRPVDQIGGDGVSQRQPARQHDPAIGQARRHTARWDASQRGWRP